MLAQTAMFAFLLGGFLPVYVCAGEPLEDAPQVVTVSVGDAVDSEIFSKLQKHYGNRLQLTKVSANNSILRLKVAYPHKQVPDILLLINTVNRAVIKQGGEVLSNIIQIRAIPDIKPVAESDEASFFTAIHAWQLSKILPQFISLTSNRKVAYGWDLPIYKDAPISTATIVGAINDLIVSWEEFGPFLSKNLGKSLKGSKQTNILEEVTLQLLSGKRGLTKESALRFHNFVLLAKKQAFAKITIKGYVSSDVSSQENYSLSQQRADKIALQLVDAGIDSSRIQSKGMGGREPVASNNTRKGRNKNRRVELMLYN